MRVLILALVLSLPHAQDPAAESPELAPINHEDFDKQIFLAVLEGLYELGPKDDIVDAITKLDESNQPENFVYSCPICTPSMSAFLTFRIRPPFYARKRPVRDFGNGVSAEQRAAILGSDSAVRRKAIENMVYGFVHDRMDILRLNAAERAQWQRALGDMREKGNAILDSMKKAGNPTYADFEGCPMCDGAGRASGN